MEELREALKIQAIGNGDLNGLLESTFAADEDGFREVVEGVISKNEIALVPSLFTFIKTTVSNSASCNTIIDMCQFLTILL